MSLCKSASVVLFYTLLLSQGCINTPARFTLLNVNQKTSRMDGA